MVLHILPGIFVTYTSLYTKLLEVAGILTVASKNGVLVFILAAGSGVVDITQIVFGIRSGIMELQFAAKAQRVSRAKRHGIVKLEGMVGRLVFVLRISVCQVDVR